MQNRISCRLLAFCLLTLLLAGVKQLPAQVTYPHRPVPGSFVQDEAGLITEPDKIQIQTISQRLEADSRLPIVVVTIKVLDDHGAGGLSIEGYASSLFDAWGIGSRERSYGILLLVSQGDRKARIELGEGWAHTRDDDAKRIMDDIIIPEFKAGAFSNGILEGVQALNSLARDEVVKTPRHWGSILIPLGVVALGIFFAASLIRSGNRGWGWGLLAFIFAMVVGILGYAFSGKSSSGGDWSGGGRSGGGGATGQW